MIDMKQVDIKEALKSNIKNLRDKAGMNQSELANAAGLSQKAISEIESGKTWPDHKTVALLAKALRVAETDLFNDPGLVAAYNFLQSKK
jgi:transcriptional regulator with XRE-family HTH domain